jgi:hypothetical protein
MHYLHCMHSAVYYINGKKFLPLTQQYLINMQHYLRYINSNFTAYVVLPESSQTWSEKKYWLNLLNFGYHLLQNRLLGSIYIDPIVLSTLQKHHGSHFPKCYQLPLVIPFGCQTPFQNVVPSVSFSIWETK